MLADATAPAALIVFLRNPEPGRVKTRLAAGSSPVEACAIYEKLLRRTLGVVSDFAKVRDDLRLFVFFTPTDALAVIRRRFPGPWRFRAQAGDHLGRRMEDAFQRAWAEGCRKVVVVGSDIADMEPCDFRLAFETLDTFDAVLGPARDGGFYLIGLRRPCPAAFESPKWGGDEVFERTRRALESSGLSSSLLPTRTDVDRAEDLAVLANDSMFHDRVSIVIPTLDAAGPRLHSLLERLEAQLWPSDEILVVEGRPPARRGTRSGDDAASAAFVARFPRCRLLLTARGRGIQLDAGARAACGDVLWFLHDDSSPPDNFGYLLRKLRPQSPFSIGCFHLEFTPPAPGLRSIAAWANLRTRLLNLPYGDQGLFCRRTTFARCGGFRRSYLMEDIDFVRSARRFGPLLFLPEKIGTSPDRYLERGIWRAGLQNHLTMLLYRLGVSDERLYSLYYKDRR